MDASEHLSQLVDLLARIGEAVGAAELIGAAHLANPVGILSRIEPDLIWVGTRRLRSPIPRVVLELDPPVDAVALSEALALERPVAVSGDVQQIMWQVLVAGTDLPDPYAHRIAVEPFRVGRWDLRLDLVGRPAGPLPGRVAGASPAYDVRERGGQVHRIEVTRSACRSDVVAAAHPDARTLLAATAAAHPAWRGGWEIDPGDDVILVYEDGLPIAGAAFRVVRPGLAMASHFCGPGEGHLGLARSALLDVVEAVALDRHCDRVRLDSSAFLLDAQIPYLRHGYLIGPPYDGDPDQELWAEREVTDFGGR